jgi:acyl-CoA reductase-like NAD-dependent aldehyde dehydrogenase
MSDNEGAENTQSQVDNAVETFENEGGAQGKLTYEELAAELAKVRREAAAKRVTNKELDSKLKEYDDWKQSQMSELEKANARAKALEEERKADLIELAIAKHGLDEGDADLIAGNTKEEIFASAKRLSDRIGKKTTDEPKEEPPNPNLFPGARGKPVGSGKTDYNEELRQALWG